MCDVRKARAMLSERECGNLCVQLVERGELMNCPCVRSLTSDPIVRSLTSGLFVCSLTNGLFVRLLTNGLFVHSLRNGLLVRSLTNRLSVLSVGSSLDSSVKMRSLKPCQRHKNKWFLFSRSLQ